MNKQKEDEMEDFFLLCLKLNEQGKKIDSAWLPIETESFAGSLDREIGTALLPTQDGGVVVSGNFRRYWKLGPSRDGKLALLPPDSSENASFEGFLARFDDNGSLKWAQTSGITGDDFTVALATDGEVKPSSWETGSSVGDSGLIFPQ